MAKPESVRKRVVLPEGRTNVLGCLATKAMSQVNTTTTEVRMAVAKFESTPATPIFAKIAVAAAKTADKSAHPIQFIILVSEMGKWTN